MRKESGCGNFTVSQLSCFAIVHSREEKIKIVTLFPLSIATSASSRLLCFLFVIVVVEMWCEYIRACTAHTFIVVLSLRLAHRAARHSVVCCLRSALARIAIFCFVAFFSAYFTLLEQTNSKAVDIQQWQRAHTNFIFTSSFSLFLIVVFVFSSLINIFTIFFGSSTPEEKAVSPKSESEVKSFDGV